MSGASKSRSKSVIKTKSQTEQIEKSRDETKDDEMESTATLEALTITPTIIRRYKMPYRNFLRDFKIQMQNENLSNQELVKIASQRWKMMTYAEKEPYIQEAAYVKEIDAQTQKKHHRQSARQQPTKRKRKCPKCGGYPASSSPSEQSTNETTEAGTAGTTESEESEEENNNDYSSDSSCYSYTTETNVSTETGDAKHDAAKKSRRQKKRTKRTRRNVKRRKQQEENSSSGSASYYANSSDNLNSITSDTAVISNVSNYTSASI